MLAEQVEVVIGVDTHKHTHTAAVVAATTGTVLAEETVTADPAGYQALVELAAEHGPLRAWAWRVPEATAPASPPTSPSAMSSWSSSTDRRVRPVERARTPTRSTPSAPPKTRSHGPTWPSHGQGRSGHPCKCC